MNLTETKKLLAVLKSIYPTHPILEETPIGYQMALSEITYEQGMAAAQVWIRTNQFFPKPSELLGLLAEARTETPDWEVGWGEVMRAIKAWGTYIGHKVHPAGPFPGWSSTTLEGAIRHVGGYEAICAADRDDLPTMRAQFRDYWTRSRRREVTALQIGAGGSGLTAIGEAS